MTELTINIPDKKLPFFMLLAEELDFVVMNKKKTVKQKNEPHNVPKDTSDIMAQFWGVISEHTTEEMHKHIAQSRTEWERDI